MSNEKNQHSSLRRWGLGIAWTFAGLVLLALLLRLSLKTSPVQHWIKNVAVSTVNQQLNAELSVDDLSGDLWKEASLSGIRLMQTDTVAEIDSIYVTYNMWAFLHGDIALSALEVYRPQAHLSQRNGQWNVGDLAPKSRESDTNSGAISINIANFTLSDGAIFVRSDSLPVESNFDIRGLAVASSLGYQDEAFDIDLRDLSFRVENTQLEQPLKVQTSASAQQDQITLEKLVFATGNSIIQSSGFANPADSSLDFELSANPISWKDIAAYTPDSLLRENAKLTLSLSGKPEQFQLALAVEAKSVESFNLSSQFEWHSNLVLQNVQAQADYFNLPALLADTTLPRLEDLNVRFSGRVDIARYQQGQGDLAFSAKQVVQPPYHFDAISGEGSVDGQRGNIKVEVWKNNQKAVANVRAEQLWENRPSIRGDINAKNIDSAYWMQDTTYAGNLSFRASFSGRGWYPKQTSWHYSLEMSSGQLMGHPITDLSVKGKVSSSAANMDARFNIHEGNVTLAVNARDILSIPAYNYNIETRDLDLGTLAGRQNFKTSLNSQIEGTGRGFDPASMQLNTSLNVDSSLVNDELIQNLSTHLLIRDSVAVVDGAQLQSTIAQGSFNLRLNMLRQSDPDNQLEFNLDVSDLDALAPLAGVEHLQARGQVKGQLSPTENESLRFLGTIDLSDIKYNDLFTTDKAQGSLEVLLQENIVYSADLDLNTPIFSGVHLQGLALKTQGQYADSTAKGQYEFEFSNPTEGRIEQSGSYALTKDSARILTTEFNVISDYRTLILEEPFNLTIQHDTLRMDTMRVSSGSEAFLEAGAPLVSATEQRAFVRGQSLNTAVIQSALLGESYFKGLLSGQFEITRKDTSLDARGELLMTEMEYRETTFDSLHVTGKVENERLDGMLSVRHEGKELVTGKANLPFKLGDPEDLSSSFFDEPVSGSLRVRGITIERFESLFAETGITQTAGILSFLGKLEGSAGEPEFTAKASLRNAKLSGVAVDSVTAGANYSHEDAELKLDASVMSLRQKAAQINARLPLYIDMKTFNVDYPQAKDSISVDIATNDLNLKALNDFLDRRTTREVVGQLNGVVHVNGAVDDLKTDGKLELRNGAVRLIPAGIKINSVNADMKFDPNQLRITNFSAKSGKGSLKASGKIALEKLVPGDLDLTVRAQNFRAANTSQYNAIINLDAKAEGSFTQPKVTGSLDFLSGFLQLQNFGEKSVETIELDSLEDDGPEVNIYDSLALDMDVGFDRRFFIRNQRYLEMEIELAGLLDLVKGSGGDLQLFGTITTPNGYARPFGKEFDLQEGSVTFSGPPDNPELMVRTRYEPPQTQEDIIIWYIIEGTVEKPKFKYESQPPMELENIISYTLFGQPFYALDSWKQVVASSGSNTTAADVALDVLLDRVEALATQKLGIDIVKIDNTNTAGETGTTITTGWYLNPKVFFAIQNVITGSTPDTGFLLEYMLRKDLKLIIRQGNDIRQGVDLKWNYDY